VIDEVLNIIGETVIGVSCYIIGEPSDLVSEYGISQDDLVAYVCPLHDADLVRFYDHFEECEGVREVDGVSRETIAKACLAVMDVDGIRGHLLLVNNLGLVVYPHDDIGFGFIATNAESRAFGVNLLSHFLSDEEWRGKISTR